MIPLMSSLSLHFSGEKPKDGFLGFEFVEQMFFLSVFVNASLTLVLRYKVFMYRFLLIEGFSPPPSSHKKVRNLLFTIYLHDLANFWN